MTCRKLLTKRFLIGTVLGAMLSVATITGCASDTGSEDSRDSDRDTVSTVTTEREADESGGEHSNGREDNESEGENGGGKATNPAEKVVKATVNTAPAVKGVVKVLTAARLARSPLSEKPTNPKAST